MNLATQVILGLLLGVGAGIFFGELVAPVGVVGEAFILLLQMTVLPYVAVSLIKGLGSLSGREATELAVRAGGFLLLFWGVAIGVVLLVPLAYPDWQAASFFSTALVEEPPPFDFLSLFIPANPFEALAQNVVPACVVFSTALGVALIPIRGKGPLIDACATLTEALGSIAAFVVRLAPYGVFAVVAKASGTLRPEEIDGLQVYLACYIVAVLFLAFWVLPGLVAALTPFTYSDVLRATRAALVTAFATGNVFVVLSVLAEKTKALVRETSPNPDESESFVEVVVPTAFALPSSGKLMALSFVLFAGWLSGFQVALTEYPAFSVVGLFSFFGHTYVAVPFLLDLFRVPSDTFQLFVIADSVVGGRFGALLASVHIATLALLSASAAAGLVRVRAARLLRFAGITVGIGLALLLGGRLMFQAMGRHYEGYRLFVERTLIEPLTPVRVLEAPPTVLPAPGSAGPTLDRIRQRGVLRAGYRKDALPHAFRNDAGELVGFDVQLLNRLAQEMDVSLELVQVDVNDLPRLLDSGYLDTAAGMAVTPQVMARVGFSTPYLTETLAFIVPDHLRDEFGSGARIQELGPLRIAVPPVPYYQEKLRRYLPEAELVELSSPRDFFRGQVEADAFLFTAEAGSAWCLIYPEFAVAVPQPNLLRAPFALPVARSDLEMARFLSGWIELKRLDGTLDRFFDYWIRGRNEQQREPRWSVIRDVLHWVE